MATATKISLDVNVPLTGTVKFVDYYPEKPNPNKPGTLFSDQWALNGTWDWINPATGETVTAEGKVYIDSYQLGASPLQQGLIEQAGNWPDGNPKFKWIASGPVRLVKTEKDRKRHVTISRLDQSAPTVAGVAPTPHAVGGGHVAPIQARAQAAPTPTPVPPSTDPWAALERQYERARLAACRVWGEDYDPTALVAATATVFIEANKRGLAHNPAASYERMPEALAEDGPPPWMG